MCSIYIARVLSISAACCFLRDFLDSRIFKHAEASSGRHMVGSRYLSKELRLYILINRHTHRHTHVLLRITNNEYYSFFFLSLSLSVYIYIHTEREYEYVHNHSSWEKLERLFLTQQAAMTYCQHRQQREKRKPTRVTLRTHTRAYIYLYK